MNSFESVLSSPNLAAVGEMRALVLAKDWSATALGPANEWPKALQVIVDTMMASAFPMAVRWGPEFVLVYNDGYRPILGDKHPWALGLAFREAWPEVQDRLGPLHADILAGRSGAFYSADLPLKIRRFGETWEEARFTVCYSPIPDDTASSGVGGVFIAAVETTERVRMESALRTSEEQARLALADARRYTAELAQRAVEEIRQNDELKATVSALRDSEARYRAALATGHMGSWETNFETMTRVWSEEAMALFGLRLPDGRGQVGGDHDEYLSTLHPDDRHLVAEFHRLAQQQDEFTAEYRIVKDDRVLWLAGRGRVVGRRPDGSARRMINIVADITERKAAEEKIRFLMREISHRSKNLLAVVQAIAAQTARSSTDMADFHNRLGARLRGLATSHDLLVEGDWSSAPLGELVRTQLALLVGTSMARVELTGPAVPLSAETAQNIGLAIHELATNALKYGALSVPNGRLLISWSVQITRGQEWVTLNWRERDGPRVAPPTRRGFGHVIIDGMVAQSLNGKATLDFASDGLNWELSFPLDLSPPT